MKGLTTVAVALGAIISAAISAAPARADDPTAGSSCLAANLNKTATTSSGNTVRCLANEQGGFSWMADTGAVGVIAQLQGQGYTVNIDRVGSHPLDQCTVTNVRDPVTVTRTNRTSKGAENLGAMETIIVSKTIKVSLDCTGAAH